MKFTDKARSGYKGDKQKALNAFRKAIKDGRVKNGETLLVEAVDRLGRKGVDETYDLVREIQKAGVHIAILTPIEKVYRADVKNDMGKMIELAAFAYQAHVYSENLSSRLKSFNANARRECRSGKRATISANVPSWLVWDAERERFTKKPEAVKAIKYVFKRTIAGTGRKRLVRELNEKFEPLSTGRKNTTRWNEQMVTLLIKSRRVVGDLESTLEGVPPFRNYYPAIITEAVWLKANAESANRRIGESANGTRT